MALFLVDRAVVLSFARFCLREMSDALQMHVPTSDGQRSSCLNYEEKALIWKNISPLEPARKASHLLLLMADFARKECLAIGKDVSGKYPPQPHCAGKGGLHLAGRYQIFVLYTHDPGHGYLLAGIRYVAPKIRIAVFFGDRFPG